MAISGYLSLKIWVISIIFNGYLSLKNIENMGYLSESIIFNGYLMMSIMENMGYL